MKFKEKIRVKKGVFLKFSLLHITHGEALYFYFRKLKKSTYNMKKKQAYRP